MMKSFFKSALVFLLTLEARLVLTKMKPRIIAITGSVGKTAAKDALIAVLGKKYHVRGSEKSFNSELGVPLTVLGLPNAWQSLFMWLRNLGEGALAVVAPGTYPELLVLEAGVDRPGDMRHLAAWLVPDTVVLTRFPDVPVHVEFFKSPEAVIEEKRFLKHALKKKGTLIINADDPNMANEKITEGQRLLSFGFSDRALVRGTFPEMVYENEEPVGMRMKIEYKGKSMPFVLRGALGTHHLYPVLAGFAVGVAEGMHEIEILEALQNYMPPKGRMHLLPGKSGAVLIDDSYNASPEALSAGCEAVEHIQTPVGAKKIAVLGDMMELGTFSVREHEKAGKHVARVADIFVAVGLRMKDAARTAREAGMHEVVECKDAQEAGVYLAPLLRKGDVIFIKGSQSMRMERVVALLLAHPEEAERYLVRQEEEWKKR